MKLLTIFFTLTTMSIVGCLITYFESFKKDSPLPVAPVNQITEQTALPRETYCIGFYNDKNQLIIVEKHLNRSLFFRFEYSYYENGKLWKVKSQNVNGKFKPKNMTYEENYSNSLFLFLIS